MKPNSFWSGFLLATIGSLGFVLGTRTCSQSLDKPDRNETIEVSSDTIPVLVAAPTPRDSIILRYRTVRVPVLDTVRVLNADTLVNDSVTVKVPITQKMYQDSTYQAWVSGYMPSLDSLKVFQPVTTITHTIKNTAIQYKTKRWGIGLQVGMGVTPNKIEPYIGIGVTYNLVTW